MNSVLPAARLLCRRWCKSASLRWRGRGFLQRMPILSVNEDYESRDWSKKFGVTANELRDAVKAVGTSASAVEQHLGKASTGGKPASN